MPHTDGEWRVDETAALGAYGVWSGPYQICSVLTDAFHTTDKGSGRLERDANARLIAAAPEMLKCLQFVLQKLDLTSEQMRREGIAIPTEALIEIKNVRALIRKATGN